MYGTATIITLNFMKIVFIKSAIKVCHMRNKVTTEALHYV
jgi:hypothetical protein